MGSNWPKVTFGSLYKEPSRNGLTKPKKVRGEGYKFINMGEIFAFDRMLNIPCDRAPLNDKEIATSLMKANDLLFARQSLVLSGAGKCSIFLGDDEDVAFESHLIRVRLDSTRINPEYVYYYFLSPQGRALISTIVEQGAGQAGIRGSDLEQLAIPLPPLEYQEYVAYSMQVIDNKITLNCQINQTLEQMVQALFKSWFVDFDPVVDNALDAGFFEQNSDLSEALLRRAEQRKTVREQPDFKPLPVETRQLFPAAFEECEDPSLGLYGWVPKGWKFKYLNSISNITYGKNLPKSKILDNGYPVYGGNGIIGAYERYLYEKPQVLISCRGAASGKVHWTKPFSFVTNNSLVIEERNVNSDFLYYSLLQQDLTTLTSGSAQPQMTIANLNPVQVLVPEQSVLSEFSKHAQMLMVRSEAKVSECESLTKLRDTLLPKLISGELRLNDEGTLASSNTDC